MLGAIVDGELDVCCSFVNCLIGQTMHQVNVKVAKPSRPSCSYGLQCLTAIVNSTEPL